MVQYKHLLITGRVWWRMCSLACSQQEAGARWQGPGIPIRNVSFRLASKVPEHREGLTFLPEVTFEVRSKKWQPLSHGQKEKYSIATPNAAAPENRLPFPQKCPHEITIWPSIPCLDIFRRLENCSSNPNLDISVHNSIVHSSQKVEAASVSINRWWIHTACPSTH